MIRGKHQYNTFINTGQRKFNSFIGRGSENIPSGHQDENAPELSSRTKKKQSRAGQYNNKQGKETFGNQSEQFDRGKRKFQRRLKSSDQDLIDQTLRVHRKKLSRQTIKGYEQWAFALADRAQEAAQTVEEEF